MQLEKTIPAKWSKKEKVGGLVEFFYKLYVYFLYLDVLQNITTYDSYVCNSWWVICSDGPRTW